MTTGRPRRPLHTERLELWPMEERWAGQLWEAAEASLPELRPWMPWTRRTGPEETVAFARSTATEWEQGRTFDFVWVRDGQVVGAGGVGVADPEVPAGEVGYWIRTDAAGLGLATEACAALVRFGFEALGLHRIELKAGVDNARSRRVAQKLGFRLEAECLRDAGRGAGGRYDCALYALLASDAGPG